MKKIATQRTVRLEPALRALADLTRLKILLMLEGRERTVGEIVGFFGLAQPTITRHLQTLTIAGLVSRRKEGAKVYYGTHAVKLGSVCMDLADSFPCCCVAVASPPPRAAGRSRAKKATKKATRKVARKPVKTRKTAVKTTKKRAARPRAKKAVKTSTRRSK